ncbi:hypothetical protein G9409_02920 [Chlorobium sp. BLA1]|uniref:Nmad3 family putative nucleotide modification protein n=1 Tax=Candidatus Chlorobium masyuteum TaxID=2716876 RepID=UPI00142484BB|nr:hypothetical protein [Candidatus Chlorobium masyuteum]NHQ59548.1 hypothetical protein [Candidatus Chlorobium masyuteum]NTU45797.1 hypothetical protein [Chlorobiaceae bacterium]
MKGLLVRVGIDQTYGGWNAPCLDNNSFCYVPIPISSKPQDPEVLEHGFETTYDAFEQAYLCLPPSNAAAFPYKLHAKQCHLDPDFRFLSYGDSGERASRIKNFFKDSKDNFIAFYASFNPVEHNELPLVYAIIGLYRFDDVVLANQVPEHQRCQNAHTRVIDYQKSENKDIVIFGDKSNSGRLKYLLPIGERRSNYHYYVMKELFEQWGGISVHDGWIQRSAYLPEFLNPGSFLKWFNSQNPEFMHDNNVIY